jgi:hypothetical protein
MAVSVASIGVVMTYSYLWFSITDWLAETQFDDLECRDPLHVGRAGYSYCFAALNVGLQAAAKTPFASWAALKDGGADREDEGRYNRAAGPSAQRSGQFRRARRKKN